MHLPTLASGLLLTRAEGPLARQPDWSKDKFPPYPFMTNADGSNITVENLRGTRLFGWKGCLDPEYEAITAAFDDFYELAKPLAAKIDWASEIAQDFWGRDQGKNRVPDERRKQIQQIFQAQQQMYAIGWHVSPPWWTSLWIEVRCSGNDGTGDPENVCKDEKPNDGRCGRGGGTPTHGDNKEDDNRLQAYTESTTKYPSLWYSRITFCTKLFELPSLSGVLKTTPKKPLQLDSWDNRARIFLHETTHLDYFMNTPEYSPNMDDLPFDWREKGKVVRDWAYGTRFTKMLRNYGLGGEVAFYPQRNGTEPVTKVTSESYAFFALGSYIAQKTGTYPKYPNPDNYPISNPFNSGGGDVRAANADPALHTAQPVEDRVSDSNGDDYEYAEGFFMPHCPGVDASGNVDRGGNNGPANPQPTQTPAPAPPPAAAKTNALSIVFQQSIDEFGHGYDWIFYAGKQGESMLCHDESKSSWRFPSKDGLNNGVAPWPTGTFHFDNVFDRACDYKNDGKGDAGTLWFKAKDGKEVAIPCHEDHMKGKQCTKAGLIPSTEHSPIAFCEW